MDGTAHVPAIVRYGVAAVNRHPDIRRPNMYSVRFRNAIVAYMPKSVGLTMR